MVDWLNFGRLSKAKVFRVSLAFVLGRILLLFGTRRLPAGLPTLLLVFVISSQVASVSVVAGSGHWARKLAIRFWSGGQQQGWFFVLV